jgi:hypothetical protein
VHEGTNYFARRVSPSLEATLAYLKVADVRSERTRVQVNHTFAHFSQPDAAVVPAVG